MAVFYAFCCLVFSAANDFSFKLFARKNRSRGLFMAVIGLVFCTAFLLMPEKSLSAGELRATVIWGLIGGFFSISSNILLIEVMSRLSAGVCSTIFRLNLALVVPLAVVIFNESLNWMQWTGVTFAVLAVLAFLPSNGQAAEKKAAAKIDFVLIILAAVLRAGMGLAYKYGFTVGASPVRLNAICGAWWVVFGIAYFFYREHRGEITFREAMTRKVAGYGVLSGLLVAGITYTMAKGLDCGDASIVLSIAQMSFLLTFFLSVIILREKITFFKVTALVCGVAALILLSQQRPADTTAGTSEIPAAGAAVEGAAAVK